MIILLILKKPYKNLSLVLLINVPFPFSALFAVLFIKSRSLVSPDSVLLAVRYSATWTENTAASLIDVKHRSVLFTIPKELRMFFFYDRTLLTKLTYAVNDIFKYQFHNIKAKNQRVHKISKYSKNYFTNSDIIHYGLITVIHTFGRDLK